MTVMEVYVAGQKIDPPDSKSLLSPMLSSLVIEGIARNTTASVFIPEASFQLFLFFPFLPTEKCSNPIIKNDDVTILLGRVKEIQLFPDHQQKRPLSSGDSRFLL
jgi:hypothetical protein